MIFQTNIDLCAKIAEKSTFGRFRMGAVIAKRKDVLGIGWNRDKTHPLALKYGSDRPFGRIHAELDACLGVKPKDLEGASIYIVRLKVDGSQGLARPCMGCLNLLRYCGFKEMCYSTGNWGKTRVEEI